MLNVPWFGWLNVLGLLFLWVLYFVAHHLAADETTRLERASSHVKIVGSLVLIPLVWNPDLVDSFRTLVAAVTAVVVPLVALELGVVAWEVVKQTTGIGIAAPIEGERTATDSTAHSTSQSAHSVGSVGSAADPASPNDLEGETSPNANGIPAYAVDLDAGTIWSDESQRAFGTALSQVCAPDSTDRDRVRGLKELANALGDEAEDDPDDRAIDLFSSIIGAALAVAVLLPPSYMAITLLLG